MHLPFQEITPGYADAGNESVTAAEGVGLIDLPDFHAAVGAGTELVVEILVLPAAWPCRFPSLVNAACRCALDTTRWRGAREIKY